MPPKTSTARATRSTTTTKDTTAADTQNPAATTDVAPKPAATPKVTKVAQKKATKKTEAADKKTDIKAEDVKIVWTPELSQALVTAIYEDEKIKQGLYPGVGANVSTAKGGGQPKTTWMWKICTVIFPGHPLYGEMFAVALEQYTGGKVALQGKLVEKIKNRLKQMAEITNKYTKSMGLTGQGISSEDDIDPESEVKTKWDLIRLECPWYFDMKELIGDRPSRVPVGLGNSQNGIDLTVLNGAGAGGTGGAGGAGISLDDDEDDDDDNRFPTNDADTSSDPPFTVDGPDVDEDDVEIKPQADIKPKLKTSSSSTKRKANAPEVSSKPKSGKKTKLEEFAEVATAEEKTEQTRLELEKAKLNAQIKLKMDADRNKTDRLKAKLDAKARIKIARYQFKMQASAGFGMGMGMGMGMGKANDAFGMGMNDGMPGPVNGERNEGVPNFEYQIQLE